MQCLVNLRCFKPAIFIGLIWAAGLIALLAQEPPAPLQLASPNGKVTVVFAVRDFADTKACPVYQVNYEGRPVILPSRLGLELAGVPFSTGLQLLHQEQTLHDSTWKPVYGERDRIRDHYTELSVELRETTERRRRIQYTFRAYDEGVAFCYTLPRQENWTHALIDRELTEFRFNHDYTTWSVYSAQGNYTRTTLSQIKVGCERPLTIQLAEDFFVAVAEAKLVEFARMKLDPLKGATNSLVSGLGSKVEAVLPITSPWRVLMMAQSPGELLSHNDLILNLNDPCPLPDTAWIKPGKVIREVTLTTVGGKACVDFAVKRKLQYVEFDAGWYGSENSDQSDARAVNVDPQRSKGPLDLAEVIQYANQRGIGIILYVNRRALERQLDEILPLYQKWGVKGVKYGFVNVGTQQWTAWLHAAIRKAAQYQLMVDVHDEYRPTGFTRTYPNLMTVEGIAGDETSPTNGLTLTILFTRMLAGPADNTICYYDQRVTRNATHAYQLAKAVCLYSPWQFLYWYDRPTAAPAKIGGAGNAQTSIGDEPELAFYDGLPTVWDDTRILHGKIGEFAMVARRHGEEWFIGYLNSRQPRVLPVPLTFLNKGTSYTATIYSDDATIATRTQVKMEQQTVTDQTVLRCAAAAQGGQAIHIAPTVQTK